MWKLLFMASVLVLNVGNVGASTLPMSDPKRIEWVADILFPDMPRIHEVADIEGVCGADESVVALAVYCATENRIYYKKQMAFDPNFKLAYAVAHVFGHAVQIRHGVADIALREITKRRDEETKLRGWVTRQAECIAGFIYEDASRNGDAKRFDFGEVFEAEPMTGSHWGRDPLTIGPQVSIGLSERAKWFAKGADGGLAACAVGEFGSDILLEALR